jgi:hypothetical protein
VRFQADPVGELLETCQKALAEGRTTEAEELARRALVLDPARVAADPLVYKMQMLSQLITPEVVLRPVLPPVDPAIVRAYSEILDLAPPRLYVEVHEAGGEEPSEPAPARPVELIVDPDECDLTIKPETPEASPLDIGLELGILTLRFRCDKDGHGSVSVGLRISRDYSPKCDD